jgi:drug/metabolite transporter (DMT)-like permease
MTEQNARLGILLMIATTFVFALQDGISRHLAGEYNVLMVVMIRYWFFAAFVVSVAARSRGGLRAAARTEQPLLQTTRGVLLALEVCVMVLAFTLLGLVESHAVFTCYPLLVAALSGPILGEKVGWRRWSGILFGFAGAMVIVQPGTETFQPAALMPVLAAFCYSVSAVMGRKMGITESGSVMAFYMMITFFYMGGLVGLILAHLPPVEGATGTLKFLLLPWTMPTGIELAMLMMIGVISAVGFWLIATAYRIGHSPTVAPFEYTAMLWATILSFLLWGELPKSTTIIGTLMIIASGIYVLRREAIKRERPLAGRGVWRSRN